MCDTSDFKDLDDEIMSAAQSVIQKLQGNTFLQVFASKAQQSAAVRDLLAAGDLLRLANHNSEAEQYYQHAVAAGKLFPIGQALLSNALKGLFVTQRNVYGDDASVVQATKSLLESRELTPVATSSAATPFVIGSQSPLGAACWNQDCRSGQRDTLQVCSRCRAAMYCSPACQKSDWSAGHKQQCKALCAARKKAQK